MNEDYDTETGELVPLDDYRPAPGMLGSPGRGTLWAALIAFQSQCEAPQRTKTAEVQGRDGRSGYKFSFAPLEEIIRVARALLAANKLGFRQFLVERDGRSFLRTVLFHASGEWSGNDYPIFAEASRAQVFQSGVTYARRQGLSLELGLAPEDDDDANVADQQQATVTPARTASRANPAVAGPPTASVNAAREAYKRVQQAIDLSEDLAALHEIYDEMTEEWTDLYRPEIELISKAVPQSLGLLRSRISVRGAAINKEHAAKDKTRTRAKVE